MTYLIFLCLSAMAEIKLPLSCHNTASNLNIYRCENKEVICYVFKDSIYTLSRGAVGTSGMQCKFKDKK